MSRQHLYSENELMFLDKLDHQEHKATDRQIAGNHYKKLAIQPAEYCQRNKLNYMESSAIKYITRWRHKNGLEDIDKAIHCLELLKEFEAWA